MSKRVVIFYTTCWCPDCSRSKRVLKAMGVSFREIDIEEVRGAEEEMRRLNGDSGKVPTIVVEEGLVLVEPSDAELRAALDRYLLASITS